MSFCSIQQLIRNKFSFPVKIDSPWELCAFRPAYGDIFEEYFNGYDFWGYGDLDVIYGDLDKYIEIQNNIDTSLGL